jgi:hypothetical protein
MRSRFMENDRYARVRWQSPLNHKGDVPTIQTV